jgi:hypothetical protein
MTRTRAVLAASAILCLGGTSSQTTAIRAAQAAMPSVGIGTVAPMRAFPPPARPTEAVVSGMRTPIGVAPDCRGNWILANTVLP